MQLGIAQVDPTVADFAGNADRILRRYRTLAEAGADLVVTPELSLCGYPGLDLWFRQEYFGGCQRAFDRLIAQIDGRGEADPVASNATPDGRQRVGNTQFTVVMHVTADWHIKDPGKLLNHLLDILRQVTTVGITGNQDISTRISSGPQRR